jgi:hypothetical protein
MPEPEEGVKGGPTVDQMPGCRSTMGPVMILLVDIATVRRLLPFVLALGLGASGCVETTSGDMALVEVRKLQAEARLNEARLASIEARQLYVAQQLSLLSGVLGTLAKESEARVDGFERRDDEALARIDRLEKAEIVRRERAAAETPQVVVDKTQALIDSGQVKVTTKNGRTKLDLLPGGTAGPARPVSPDIEDPWAAPVPRKPVATKKPTRQEDLGF